MHSSTFFVAILALARVALATPPACLIAALGAQSNPSDLKSLCGTLEQQVAGNITEKCSGDAESSAMSVFSATCLASESVTITITSASSSGSKTGSASATTTGTVKATATGSGSKTTGTAASTGSSTGTSSGSTASETSKSGGSSLSPQSAFVVAPLLLAAGFAQYLL